MITNVFQISILMQIFFKRIPQPNLMKRQFDNTWLHDKIVTGKVIVTWKNVFPEEVKDVPLSVSTIHCIMPVFLAAFISIPSQKSKQSSYGFTSHKTSSNFYLPHFNSN